MVTIFGKPGCPYTKAALDQYRERGTPYEYVDVRKDTSGLARMLHYSGGRRCVPVILDGDKIIVGFGGT